VVDQFGTSTQNLVGDPQWIGILEHPDQPHSSSNRYIARYCFIAVPIGNSLDLNAIYNNAKGMTAPNDGFLRNEGVGSWEINLAGFLAGLNPNMWNTNALPYNYDPTTNLPSSGLAFNDAMSILQYRYNFNNPSSFSALYNAPATFFTLLGGINIDGYSAGPLMTNFSLPAISENATLPWSGADNPNHYFTSQDLFNIISAPGSFPNDLRAPGFITNDNFNRYTYYRMLSQMGTDSAPEDTNKINLNYINVGGIAATNYIPWDALTNGQINGTNVNVLFPAATIADGGLAFFTNAVNRLLATQPDFAGLSSGFIPIYPTNRYTPAVHRLLQLAANIYDATTVHPFDGNFPVDQLSYPSVFRPTFGVTNIGTTNIVFINGYTNNLDFFPPVDASTLSPSAVTIATNVYNVPWIVGARQGLPNLNQIAMQGTASLTRKLQIVKPSFGSVRSTWRTNIQYALGISNNIAVEAWNSYARNYPRGVTIVCFDETDVGITNQNGPINLIPPQLSNYVTTVSVTVSTNAWNGFNPNAPGTTIAKSFDIPLNITNAVLPNAVFHPNGTYTVTPNVLSVAFDPTVGFPQPMFGLNITNRLRFYMLDSATLRVIDYAQFTGMTSQQDLMSEFAGDNDDFGPGGVWDTNRVGGTTNINDAILGVQNQVDVSQHDPGTGGYYEPTYSTPVTTADWNKAGLPAGFSSVAQAVQAFKDFFNNSPNNQNLSSQVPYTPTRSVAVYYSWQANDPLVHYTLGDLTGVGDFATAVKTNYDSSITNLVQQNIGRVNDRYLPWGGLGNGKSDAYPGYIYNMALMDPQIMRSDLWQFPTNKFPNIGWLGRVHRGTPWQTVYMKSPTVDHGQWASWSGNSLSNYPGLGGFPYDDSVDSQPINDRAIFDLFTTAPNDNATRGQLSINQTGLAAWTAVLAGAIAMTNDPANPGNYGPLVIDPTTVNPVTGSNAIQQIVSDLNTSRANNPLPGNVWTRLGDVLSTPSLTVNSPFLNTNGLAAADMPNDQAYERIPQQIMSLLRVGSPRYVVYAYGQSLKPAANSLVTGGPFFQLCTNYQITGEVATRTVVRFEPSQALNSFNAGTPFNPTRNPVMVGQKNFAPPGQAPAPNQIPSPRAVIESFTVLPPE
jgi:hypothetical protein